MNVLGIESSCDETGVALVATREGAWPMLRAQALHSQVQMHEAYGGVVPELASRDHIRRLLPLTRQVLRDAGAALAEIDVVAFTRGPGLAGALLTGAGMACALGRGTGPPGARRAPPRRASAVAVPVGRPAAVPVRGVAGLGRPHPADVGAGRGPL